MASMDKRLFTGNGQTNVIKYDGVALWRLLEQHFETNWPLSVTKGIQRYVTIGQYIE